jgi:RNA polymerase sigma factor (sigma-70 family)
VVIVERVDWDEEAARPGSAPGRARSRPQRPTIADMSVVLHRALVARNGLDRGADAAAAAMAWAWEHRDELDAIDNPVGYLYRVGQSSLRRGYRLDRLRVDLLPDTVTHDTPGIDHDLFDALRELTPDQRVAVVLVHMYGFSYGEVAGVIGASDAAVTNYVHRGLKRLREVLRREQGRPR